MNWKVLRMIVAIGWATINGESMVFGIIDAPKKLAPKRIEYLFPGYQAGLWLGTRSK